MQNGVGIRLTQRYGRTGSKQTLANRRGKPFLPKCRQKPIRRNKRNPLGQRRVAWQLRSAWLPAIDCEAATAYVNPTEFRLTHPGAGCSRHSAHFYVCAIECNRGRESVRPASNNHWGVDWKRALVGRRPRPKPMRLYTSFLDMLHPTIFL